MLGHPFEVCATKYCCFCCYFDPDVTCCIIAFLCITTNAFSEVTNYGIWHWGLYLISLATFFVHLLAGILLFLGGFWKNYTLKLAYCWLVFLGILLAIVGVVLFVLLRKENYIIWGSKCHNFSDVAGMLLVVFNTVWIVIFDIYTTMIVLGNTYHVGQCCEAGLTSV